MTAAVVVEHPPARGTRARRPGWLAGARAMGPWLTGLVPFGLVIGISAGEADVPVVVGWLTGPLVFAGSAQLVTIDLLDRGAAPLVVIAAAVAVNVRLVLYGALLAPHWSGTTRGFRALAAYFLVDPTVAVGVSAYEEEPDPRVADRRYLGGAAVLWVAWVGAITVGAWAGHAVPGGLPLTWVIPLYLVAQVARRRADRGGRVGASTAAAVGLVAHAAPMQLGPVIAIAAGIAAALVVTRRS